MHDENMFHQHVRSSFCGVGRDLIEYVTEVNPLRVGTFLPGVHIPKVRARGFQGEALCP